MQDNSAQQGFSMVEVLIALIILGVVMAAIFSALLANTSLNTKVERKAEAARISEERMESYRQLGRYGAMATRGQVSETVVRNGQNYNIVTDFCPNDRPSTMACSNTAVFIRLSISNNGNLLQKTETFYTSFGKEDE